MAVRVKNHLLGQLINAGAISEDEVLSMAEQIKRHHKAPEGGFIPMPWFDKLSNLTYNHGTEHIVDLGEYYVGPKPVAFKMMHWNKDHVMPTTRNYMTIYENGLFHIERYLPVGNYVTTVGAITVDGIQTHQFKVIIH